MLRLPLVNASRLANPIRSTACLAWALAVIFILFEPVQGHALDPGKRITQYQHRMWRVQDGFLPNSPTWISQAEDGYLWVGSRGMEALRFDGVRFVPWSAPAVVGHPQVFSADARSGGFWISGRQGVTHVKGERVLSHFDLGGPVMQMREDASGTLWAAIIRYDGVGEPLCKVTDEAAHCFGKAAGIDFHAAYSLLPDKEGGFWIGTDTALVHWKSGQSETYEVKALRSNAGQAGILALVPDSDGSLWVGIGASGPGLGLEKFTRGEFEPVVTRNFDGRKVNVSQLLMDRDQNLWIATGGQGLYRIHGENVDHFGMADGLSSDTLYGFYEDREGTLWVATANGLDSFSNRNVTTFTHSAGLYSDYVFSVLAARDGNVWAGENGALDSIRNGVVSSVRVGHGLPGHQVTSMLEDRKGRLWVGVDDELYLYEDHRFRRLPEPNHRPLGMVVGLTEDSVGNVWAECASNPRKLVRIRDFRVQKEFLSPQVPGAHSIAADPRGGIWLFTMDGNLALFRNGVVQTFSLKTSGALPLQVEAEQDGSVLAAAAFAGLFGVHHGRIQRLTMKNGLPCDGAFAFIRDKRKNLWLEAPCGYLSISDSEMQRWWAHPDAIVRYQSFDASDGALTGQIPFNAASIAPDGRLWFATGFLQGIDPERLYLNSVPPPVQIEQIVSDQRTFTTDLERSAPVRLPPLVRDLEVDYTALSLIAPSKVLFRYKLDGLDRDWRDAGNRRAAFYTNLPPGNYRFHVIACNNDGVWNDAGTLLDFSIAPAYYQTVWFRTVCALLLVFLLWMLHRLRLRQVEQQFNVALDARVDERTRIARDLHDTLLQSFQGLLLRFQAASNLLPAHPSEAKERVDSAIEQGSAAIAEGREAVYELRSTGPGTTDLPQAIRNFAQEQLTQLTPETHPDCRVQVEGVAIPLNPIVRDEIFRIVVEALRNAVRHAEAKQIEVEIEYEEQQLRVRVCDDGKGIDQAIAMKAHSLGHWGLRGMEERAKLVGGRLEIRSKSGSGTEVVLTVPGGSAYATPRNAKRPAFPSTGRN